MAILNVDLPGLPILSLGALVLGLLAVYLALRVLYNVFLHPLRKFPGPLLHTTSHVGYSLALARGTLAFDVAEMHVRHGPVVRIAPDQLSFIEPEAWRDIYGHRTGSLIGADELAKDENFYHIQGIERNIVSESRENHSVLRRHLAHGFSDRSMRQQEPIIGSYVDLLIRRLRESALSKPAEPLDMVKWYNFTSFDVISDLAFGESFGSLQSSEYHPWVRQLAESVTVFGMGIALQHLGLQRAVAWLAAAGKAGSLKEHFRRTNEMLDRRMALSFERPDLIEGLLRIKNLDIEKLRTNASTLIIAGSETTASLLSGATYLLLTNPDKLERLKQEVRGAFADDKDITLTSVSRLTYMLACLDEALRIYPPVPIASPRRVAKGGASIAGHIVPENSVVGVWQLASYRSGQNFKDPLAYKPERFLDEGSACSGDKMEAFNPFQIGPRNCIGKNLAYAEMRPIMAKLLYNFDIELADESIKWLDQPIYLMWEKPPLNVYLKPVVR